MSPRFSYIGFYRGNSWYPSFEGLLEPPASCAGSYFEVTMREFTQKLHRDLGPTRLWGYNGMYPGPTFDVIKGETTYAKWMNDLPKKHFLPIDTTIQGAEKTLPQVRTVVHLHGGK